MEKYLETFFLYSYDKAIKQRDSSISMADGLVERDTLLIAHAVRIQQTD